MKKSITLSLLMTLSFVFAAGLKAQQFVTTEVQNRNVIIEEFTGKHCTWCPEGQMVANAIAKENPGRVFVVNIHTGPFSPVTFPNLNTDDGAAMMDSYQLAAFPAAFVNRTSEYEIGREQWSTYALNQLSQTAECNIDGQVVINPQTREAAVNVEVYYTSDNSEENNYLTVMMIQDDIVGDQEGGHYNPEQYINGEYHHMHVLRDIVTPTWGEMISPTTEGTLITKTYNFMIPEVIGDPNGANVDINKLSFLAFVTEYDNGMHTCPTLNVNELVTIIEKEENILPEIRSVYPLSYTSCSDMNTLRINVVNAGKQEINSLKFEVVVNDVMTEFLWEGNIASYQEKDIDFEMSNVTGSNEITVSIVEANASEYDFTETIEVDMKDWLEIDVESEDGAFVVEVAQDKYGHQTRWFIMTSDYTVLASGGPYSMLSEPGTELHQDTVMLASNSCVRFVITDAGGNGINNTNGEGYYRILDPKGNVIIESDGKFGIEESHLVMINETISINECQNTMAKAYPNPTDGEVKVECQGMKEIAVIIPNGQTVENIVVNDDIYMLNMNDYKSGIYYLKITTDAGVEVHKVIKI